MESGAATQVPVVVLTGYLGAGKTTLLNHLLRQPGARVGVVINDFGDVNVDAGLVSGQVGDPASITGGCLCCIEDTSGLDDALARLSRPRLRLDVIVVEASGLAEPGTLASLVRLSDVRRVRLGGVVDVVDAAEYFHTLDDGSGQPPVRFDAATLVVINKVDRLPASRRAPGLARLEQRVRERNPSVHLVHAVGARIDPTLIYDAASIEDPPDQLPIGALLREHRAGDGPHHDHRHAASVTVSADGPIEPADLVTLFEDPPATAYRIKGVVRIATDGGTHAYVVNIVGRAAHIARISRPTAEPTSELVAIGLDLDTVAVGERLRRALQPTARPSADGLRRLQHWVRLSR
ncbi:MAG: GTP-binding protein [Nocardioides sp.]|uniref:CobW family GTP-binding protein n=1 Tax=Nocardioides sp. TaxID=35761 RepID=UPI0039E2FF87